MKCWIRRGWFMCFKETASLVDGRGGQVSMLVGFEKVG